MGVTKDLKVATALAKALSHPRRIKILQEAEKGRISPVGFSKTEDLPVSKASYHFGELKKAGCLKMVDTVAGRGAVEHVYAGTAQGKKLLSLIEAL